MIYKSYRSPRRRKTGSLRKGEVFSAVYGETDNHVTATVKNVEKADGSFFINTVLLHSGIPVTMVTRDKYIYTKGRTVC